MEIALKLPNLHEGQKKVLEYRRRFNVLKNGRRWGKTTLSIELAIETMLEGRPVGYWCPTYKDLSEVWNELKFICFDLMKEKNEQLKQIVLITGGKIDFWSMEDPNSGRGRKYKRAIIDEAEKASKFKEAWSQTIRPTLADYRGDAWILSTPKAVNSYFHELWNLQYKFPDWVGWCMPTSTNPYIAKDEIEQARIQLDPITFRQEFLAESTQTANRPFMYCFEDRHISKEAVYKEGQTVYLSFDFNVNPMTCSVVQNGFKNGKEYIHFIDEVHLYNSDIYEVCRVIESRYPNAHFMVTGDRSGLNKTGLNRNMNYYKVIKDVLRLKDAQFKIPVNPFFEQNIVLCNSILANHPEVLFHPEKCKETIYDMRFVEWDGQKVIKDDRTKRAERADNFDCVRYYFNTFHNNFIKKNV